MLIFDRIVLTVLAVGVWVLVLSPREIRAHSVGSEHTQLRCHVTRATSLARQPPPLAGHSWPPQSDR